MSSSGRSSYTPSFSLSSPSSSFPSSVSSSPSSVWRSSSSSRSPQRSDVDNPMNNLHGRRGHQTIPLTGKLLTSSQISLVRYSSDLSRSMSYSPHYSCRRASPYYTRRRASLYYSWQPKTYCAQCNRYRPYSYSRSPVRHRYLAYSPYDSGEFSPDDSYHVRRYCRGRRSPSPLRARRRSRRSYSHSVSPRPRRSYRRNYPRPSPEPKRRTVRESYSPSSSRRHRSSRSYRRSSGRRHYRY